MSTTNLLVDYVISGTMGFLTLFLPLVIIDMKHLTNMLTGSSSVGAIGAIFVTVLLYALGILFYQFSDFFKKKLFVLFGIKSIDEKEIELNKYTEMKYHEALQYIVCKSEKAYDYLSFRRTIIRIMRTILAFGVFTSIMHMLYSAYFSITSGMLAFSLLNMFFCVGCVFLSAFAIKILIILEIGYFSAMINFVQVIGKGGK